MLLSRDADKDKITQFNDMHYTLLYHQIISNIIPTPPIHRNKNLILSIKLLILYKNNKLSVNSFYIFLIPIIWTEKP